MINGHKKILCISSTPVFCLFFIDISGLYTNFSKMNFQEIITLIIFLLIVIMLLSFTLYSIWTFEKRTK